LAPDLAPEGLSPNQTVGPYCVLRLLGRGATGAVYLARPAQPARRVPALAPAGDTGADAVALKVLALPREADGLAELQSRFAAEAALAARLRHPGIATTLAAGTEGSLAWIAMELAPGVALDRYTQPARLLPEALVLRLAQRIAEALHHAHGAGIVHRDIKPANVMVDLPGGSLRITDFGIAHLADAERTRTGLVLGSPAFLAPEQLAGGAATPAGDLYALGVTLFQLLTGRLPFEAASMGELLREVATAPPPPLANLRPELPPARAEPLAALLERLLAKRPAQRPADAQALAAELEALQARFWPGEGGPKSRVPGPPDTRPA
jgi:serine/threonine-protein kinase